jgi:hypothetical protein
MAERGNELLPLATRIAREFDNIPQAKQAAHKLAGAAITSLRERLEAMGFQGVDTLGFLKSIHNSGCGVPPQTVRPHRGRATFALSPQVTRRASGRFPQGIPSP